MRRLISAAVVLVLGLSSCAYAAAQGRAGAAPGGAPDEPVVTPFELQRLFDSYALLQAQEQLKISDEQYTRFLPRFKALQDVRRQALQQRTRALADIRRLLGENADEAQIKDRLRQLDEMESRGQADARKAYDGIDQVLDLRQQAQFRLFEEQMERRKIELVTRARQAIRENNRSRRQGEPPR